MKEIHRTIVAAIILSRDNKILMGRKDPAKGGVYADCWHIPGGGVDDGETMKAALIREVKEEVGLDVNIYEVTKLPFIRHGSSEKTLTSGETVLCHMEFNRFEVRINNADAGDIPISLNDDLVEVRWFTKEELQNVKQIPGGREFFIEAGYMDT